MPIECKVSNSSTNSVKRLNNDAEVNASIWQREFGTRQIVPVAVCSRLYTVNTKKQCKEGGLNRN